jgi:beta-galactosidase
VNHVHTHSHAQTHARTGGYYKAWWRDWDGSQCRGVDGKIGLSLSPSDWTAPTEVGQQVFVVATTCAHSVELSVNGVSQGPAVVVERYGYAQWTVKFAPGKLTAVARDASGAVVANAAVVTAGAPAAVKAWIEPVGVGNGSRVAAGGRDVALVGVALVDAAGVVVPDADMQVQFSVTSGPAVVLGTASGDPADHVSAGSSTRTTFHGLARAVVASSSDGAVGSVKLTIAVVGSAAGVTAATVEFTVE